MTERGGGVLPWACWSLVVASLVAMATLDRLLRDAGRADLSPFADVGAAFAVGVLVSATLGAVVPPDDYWPAIVEVCARHGVLLIADEVMTGIGRTGR